jgi:alpha-glucoside transport system substrate-binding protein
MVSLRFRGPVTIAALVGILLFAAGCGSSNSSSGNSGGGSKKVVFLGGWGAGEKTDFQAILNYCNQHYPTQITYDEAPGGDVTTELATRVQGGHPPDLAALSTPSSMQQYVAGNSLVPITWLNKSKFNSQYSPFWRKLGTINGKFYAIYMKADVKSLVWYSPKKFSAGGYTIPKTWSQLMALSRRMVSQGKQPWAFGVGGSPASPWTLTDFLENIYLSKYGPAQYTKWYEHKIPWTDPTVQSAMSYLNQIVGNNSMISGGRQRALSQAWDQAAKQMITDPKSEFFQEATFVEAGVGTDLPKAKVGTDYSAFAFPQIKSWPVTPMEVGPNGVVAFHDTPGVRAAINCLTDPKALSKWAKLGGYISPNSALPMSAYPDPLTRKIAGMLNKAGKANLVVGDASDLMPPSLGSDYEFTELQRWFQNPSSTSSILGQLETKAKTAYKSGK